MWNVVSSFLGNVNKQQKATAIALAFHISGCIAIGFFKSPLFISLTPLNLLVSAALIFYTQEKINRGFLTFCSIAFLAGFGSEWIGINTGMLFGEYEYGTILGPKWQGVPWLIGLQWMVVVYCAGISMSMLQKKFLPPQAADEKTVSNRLLAASVVIDGALLAVFFDWVLEPVAIALGFWSWKNNEIPFLNYVSWWLVSAFILLFFQAFRFPKHNLFAVHLLMIQVMFFLLMRAVMG
jgi:bisanhydrobacterioruberin hydratase